MKRIAVFTSGGDSPGMNAAVRAVVRSALDRGAEVFAVYEGYQGLVDGGDRIRQMDWTDVGGILQRGGTIIGSARCADFRERNGRLKAAYNLVKNKIEGLVIIGGDGSLTGANILHEEWSSLLAELVETKQISKKEATQFNALPFVGMIGSIDNDMFGSDMTIGADTALHRIVDAVDAITSTAASHQRSFVVEVMGRHCGYLAMMSALACGADWVLIPESPPDVDDWEAKMCEVLAKGREVGRRDSMVIVAEGARDRHGNPITSQYVKQVLEDRLGEDTRITVLGHVQRGGAPSAFDRNLSTLLGHASVEWILAADASSEPQVMGLQGNKITHTPLNEALVRTWAVGDAIKEKNFEKSLSLRGKGFLESFQTVRTLVRALPHDVVPGKRRLRIAVMNAGGPAPGMNTAVRAATRIGLDDGHIILGIHQGFEGLINGDIEEFDWMSVAGWATRGGSDLGTSRVVPEGSDFYAIARNLEEHNIEGIMMIGGWSGYESALKMYENRYNFPAFNIPIICLPATINNNLPGAELSVGADTALNSIVESVDKIKQSAVASKRVFVVEVMGRYCGYLAMMGAMASGAERVYIHEEGVTLKDMVEDVNQLVTGFKRGKRLGMLIRNEFANEVYSTHFMKDLFEEEGGDLFDVRQAILGHLQQGGDPSPFDRILATRMVTHCLKFLEEQIGQEEPESACIGQVQSHLKFTSLEDISRLMRRKYNRPKKQWWLDLRKIEKIMAQPAPSVNKN
ncbi:MAG: 6-phosphofructokinase [Chloroflexi bacterium]|nr:6-phosphofructokinase [Chloroflexota bacterium]